MFTQGFKRAFNVPSTEDLSPKVTANVNLFIQQEIPRVNFLSYLNDFIQIPLDP